MAILQVNVRPATRLRRSSDSQRWESSYDVNDLNRNDALESTGGELEFPDVSASKPGAKTVITGQAPIWQRVIWTLMPWTTIGRAIVSATQRLSEAGSDTSHLDAQVILAYVLEVERSWLFAHYDYKLNPSQTNIYTELVARRAAAEPVAYIVGRREFYGLDLTVDHRVLIPRPETELLVDAVLDHIESRADGAVHMVDVGTGSGAIALAVATNCPDARIYAVDISADALAVAQTNVDRLDARGQIMLLQGDLLAPVPQPVDIIAANLPYINSQEYDGLAAGVREYEPQVALEAGPEGLDAIRRLLAGAPAFLRPGGVIFLEIGYDQGQVVPALVKTMIPSAKYVGLHQDYHGHDRLVVVGMD